MYDPIYSANVGLCGFRCRCKLKDGKDCRRVVPTYRGIVMHCRRVHGLAAQMEMAYGEASKAAAANDEPVRGSRRAEQAVLLAAGEANGAPGVGKDDLFTILGSKAEEL